MFARHPRIARRWADEYGVPKNLPDHVTAQDRHEALKRRAKKGHRG
jgi:hypothetical protein